MKKIQGITGVSDTIRLPRAGIVRLGEKEKNERGKEYPRKLDYFSLVDAPLIAEIYGDKPRELKIIFPVNDSDTLFDQAYVRYGASGWKCRGDGVEAIDRESGEYIQCLGEECPHYGDDCKRLGRLQFCMPEVPGSLGVYEVRTTSINSILNINAGLAMLSELTGGQVAWIPLLLKLEPAQVSYTDSAGKQHSTTIYVLRLDLPVSLLEVKRIFPPAAKQYALPEPSEDLPDDLYPKSAQEIPALPAAAECTEDTLPEVADDWTPDEPEVPDYIVDGFAVLGTPEEEQPEIIAQYTSDNGEVNWQKLCAKISEKVVTRDSGLKVIPPVKAPAKSSAGGWSF